MSISYEDGNFSSIGTMRNTTDGDPFEQSFSLDQVAFDVEWKLRWLLDGNTGTMKSAPATITGLEIEGKAIPDKVRVITMVVEATAPRKAGGTRSHALGTGLRADIETLSFSSAEKLTFKDPYNNERTVYIVDSTVLLTGIANRLSVPEGSIQLRLVEVV